MQLRVWASVVKSLPEGSKFLLVGSVRDPDDQRIVDELKFIVKEFKIEDSVEFKINVDRKELL